MSHKDRYTLAAASLLSLFATIANAEDAAKPKLDTVVVLPKPAAAAASQTTAAVNPVVQPAATVAATAPVEPAKPATVEVKLPAPVISLPSSPPIIAVEKPAKQPQTTTAAATQTQPAAGSEKAAAETQDQTKVASLQVKPVDPAAKKKAADAKAKDPSAAKDDKQAKLKSNPSEEKKALEPEPGQVVVRTTPKFFFGLFDAPKPKPVELSEDQVKHEVSLATVPDKKKFKVKEEFVPVTVPFKGYKPGTIVIDTQKKYLYFVESPTNAIRYAVAVGKEGLLFTGKATVGAKQPWPRWIPTKEMIARDPKKYGRYVDGMDGGPDNPLGARAIYLYQGKQDTYLRIHGTNQPNSIGTASSNGCFRMINEHVIDLYDRVEQGAQVVVL